MDAEILCIGRNSHLLALRCRVLKAVGYKARMADPGNATSLLLTANIGLLIFSSDIREDETERILAFAGDTPSIILEGMIFPRDLLVKVRELIKTKAQLRFHSTRL